MFLRVVDGKVVERSRRQPRRHGEFLLAPNLTRAELAEYGWVRAAYADVPEPYDPVDAPDGYDSATHVAERETDPTLVDGEWTFQYTVRPKTADEVQEEADRLGRERVEAKLRDAISELSLAIELIPDAGNVAMKQIVEGLARTLRALLRYELRQGLADEE